MGGGAGVRWKFWMDYVTLAYHPYSKKSTGVLVPVAMPDLIRFEAYGYMDGMGDVRGNLFTVTDFVVEVTDEKRQEVKEYFEYVHDRQGNFCLHKHDTYEIDCSYEMLIWGGYSRGDIKRVTFDLEGDVEMDAFGYSPAVTWSCRLEPTEEFYYWWEDVFEEYPGLVDGEAEDAWFWIEENYRLPKEKWNGR